MFACTACSGSDPTQDTVKFDASALVAQQQQREREVAEQQRQAADEARRVEEEAAERKRIQELRRQEEEVEEAKKRAVAEEEERERLQLVEQKRIEEEQRRAQEAESARLAAEQQERKNLELEVVQRAVAVKNFLQQHGFKSGASGAKKSMMSTTYPLHIAAKAGDAKMVEMLLKEGANAAQKDSSGKTPVQVAEKSNKGSSHAPVLRALAGGAALSVGAGGRAGGC